MPITPLQLIRWFSGASLPDELPIHDLDADPGLMGPGSATWRLHREQWLILGGARAFLLQAAHPVVAQGALDHSAYAEDPFGRVVRTVMAMSVFLTGTTQEANAMARQINQIHLRVHGTLAETVGRYHAGEPYCAMELGPLLWVHVAFVDSMLVAYETFVGALSAEERDQYWQESLRYARRLGLTDAALPPTYPAMQAYLRQAIVSGEVAVGEGARTIARTILYPPLPWSRRWAWGVVRLIASGQLPQVIRSGYGLRWTWTHRLAFGMVCRGCQFLRWVFPRALGQSVLVTFAERRIQSKPILSDRVCS
jgi:uncharacterized protein (DUF2236 family)